MATAFPSPYPQSGRQPPARVTAGRTPGGAPGGFPGSFTGFNETGRTPGVATQSGPYDTHGGSIGDQLNTALGATAGGANQGTQNATQSRNSLLDILGQDPSKVLGSYVSSAMPEFNKALEGIRENAIQRGISTGDLGTSYEGDLASAFQKNIAGEAANLYGTRLSGLEGLYGTDTAASQNNQNRYLDLLTGQRDYQEQQREANQANKSSLFGSIGNVLGGLGSAAIFGGLF